MKKVINIFLTFVILFSFFAPTFIASAEEFTGTEVIENNEVVETPTEPVIKAYQVYLEDANGSNMISSFDTYTEAYNFALVKEAENINNNMIIYKDGRIRYVTYGLVNFNTKGNASTTYTVEFNGRSGYTNGAYGADAAFLGTSVDGSQVRFKQSGVIGWVSFDQVEILNMNAAGYASLYTSCYKMELNDVWELRHNITTNVYSYSSGSKIILGQERPYGMQDNTYYLSYDGHYFYPESLEGYRQMIRDYKSGTYANAINASNPFYNYYQFISHRSISNYTSVNIRQDLSSYNSKAIPGTTLLSTQSQLFGEETTFIQYQNEFGANAMLAYGVAKNESAFGRSNFAIYKNNLFGHSAYDSNPGAADVYPTVAIGIYYHTKGFISEGYADPCDGYQVYGDGTSANCHKGRYYGAYLGDKNAGINVKYASDPYWGEKAAKYYYYFDKQYGLQDYKKYGIGVKTSTNSYPIKANPTNNSATLYTTGPSTSYAVTILSAVKGEAIDGNDTWYKIQTDPTLNNARTGIVQDYGYYDYNHNIGYIHSSNLTYVQLGKEEKNRYIITFNPNGGTFNDNISVSKMLTVEEYVIPDINPPSKDGYRFIGWDKEIEAATEATTYTAVYEDLIQNYTITFDANGGKFSDDSGSKNLEVKSGTTPTVEEPTREGYIFNGWNPVIESATKNTTYTAIWKEIIYYDITFNAGEGVFEDSTATKVVKVEENKLPTVEEPTKEGYKFIGWNPAVEVASKNTTYVALYEEFDESDLIKKEAFFYLDSVSIKNDKLQIKGFQTIEGIDNNLTTEIKYTLIFVDTADSNKVYRLNGERITDSNNIPFPSYGMGSNDYSYAWFNFETDFEDIEDGNYTMTVLAYTDKEYSTSVLSNRLFAPQISSYSGKKEVLIRNVYYDAAQPIEFIVRSEKIADKTTNTYTYNQFDQFFELNFTDDNKLHLKGYTYSYGMDLAKTLTVTRKIIFENKETYETYKVDINAIEGDYEPALPEHDSLSKALSWYDYDIDVSSLEKGTYTIYLATTSNISDVGELTDLFNQDISAITKIIDDKKYEFKVLSEYGNALELIIS